jgi:hypothetical protein
MKNRIFLIEESLNEFAKRGKKSRVKKMRDIYSDDEFRKKLKLEKLPKLEEPSEEEIPELENIKSTDIFKNIDTSDMENEDEIVIKDEQDDEYTELKIALRNELLLPEVDRAYVKFSIQDDPEHTIIEAVPMAELQDGGAFLFKGEDKGYKKIYVKDIVIEK